MDCYNEAHNNSKYVYDRKVQLYFHFELTVLIYLLVLTLCYYDDIKRVDTKKLDTLEPLSIYKIDNTIVELPTFKKK